MFAGVIDKSPMNREKCRRAGSPCDGEGTNSQRFVCFHTPYLLEGRVSMLDVAWVPLNRESKMQFNLPLRPPELLKERFPGLWDPSGMGKANGAHFQMPS